MAREEGIGRVDRREKRGGERKITPAKKNASFFLNMNMNVSKSISPLSTSMPNNNNNNVFHWPQEEGEGPIQNSMVETPVGFFGLDINWE